MAITLYIPHNPKPRKTLSIRKENLQQQPQQHKFNLLIIFRKIKKNSIYIRMFVSWRLKAKVKEKQQKNEFINNKKIIIRKRFFIHPTHNKILREIRHKYLFFVISWKEI